MSEESREAQEDQEQLLEQQKLLYDKTREVNETMVDLITSTTDLDRLRKIDKYLSWLKIKTTKIKEEPGFESKLPDLVRGNVVHVNLGFNIGNEFGGEHYAIVLRNCPQRADRVLILPITSQEPKRMLSIYVSLGTTRGIRGKHWANILNVKNVSKQRINALVPGAAVSGPVLNRISTKIVQNVAVRPIDNINQD